MNNPVFVVTGAPNKGKSTFIKAMTNDPNIRIDDVARTTTASKPYSFRSRHGDETLLTIWDTPGFENATEVYEIISGWSREHDGPPLQLYRKYIEEYKNEPDHRYEVEIFKPMADFACIVYIADCSKSFSREDYLREIQLLQLTNLPRIAILNPVDGDQHIDSWRNGLREYFHNIKVFNPHKTTFEEKLSTLGAFSHLHDEWEDSINRVIEILKEDRKLVLEECARIIRKTILKIYDKEFEIPFDGTRGLEEHKQELLALVRNFVQKTMNESQEEIIRKFGIPADVEMKQNFRDNDLFDEAVRKRNVSPHQRGFIGALAGGAVGAAVDTAAGGLTFGVFTAIISSAGYVTGYFSDLSPEDLVHFKKYFSSDRKNSVRVKHLNSEVGFLVINRLRQVVSSLYNRTAVNTEKIVIRKDLDNKQLFGITRLLTQMAKSQNSRYSESNKKELLDFIHTRLTEDQKKI